MKKQALLIPLMLVSAQAFADAPSHNFGIYMRNDMEKNTKDGTDDVLKFRTNYLRLNFKGSISDKTTYRIRFRLDRPLDSTGKLDGMGAGVNYAYIDHKVSDTLTLRAGKQYFAGVCGREGDYSGADVYRYSLTCNANPFYRTGFAIKPKFGDQSFTFAFVNSGNDANQSGPGVAATWYGKLMGGALKPIVSLVSFSTEKQALLASSKNTYIGAGAQYTNDAVKVDVDYMTRSIGDRTVGGGGTDLNGNSFVVNGRLSPNSDMQPIFKFEKSSQDAGGTTGMDRSAVTLGVEYFPNKGKKGVNWRTHAVYTTATDSFDNGAADVKDTKIIVGYSVAFTGG